MSPTVVKVVCNWGQITFSNPSYQQVIVYYNTSDGTAKVSNFDYNSGLRTIIFNPGETLKTISFGIRGDKKLKRTRHFCQSLWCDECGYR
ncbi:MULTISPECIES: Calx-beta domain-containing protein [Nostoc]|uniref:Calx-beta domain-containing protein n=2 Tax=Nostoc TaxID=1177 RepID=A0ABR8I5Q8_9NOSO|nr:hypothetical protein [Nostoc linckia FACHB-391]MBD2646927.1 hypothetical protein [Nostoc foliaceum FACHB-393]